MDVFKIWPTWFMVGLFLMSVGLATWNPFALGDWGVVWYLLPAVVLFLIVIVRPTISSKSLDEQQAEKTEQIKSFVRHIITTVLSVVATLAAFKIQVPGAEAIVSILDYITGNLDSVVSSVVTIVAFIGWILNFFSNKGRFETRAGRKIK